MRILITGSTSAHVSQAAHSRWPTFAGILRDSLTADGNDVEWIPPSVFMDSDYIMSFDRVLVGLTSPASLAAHYVYGALSVIGHAMASDKLSLFLDAPEPHRVAAGLSQASSDSSLLTKSLYGRRKEYAQACVSSVSERLAQTVRALCLEPWPLTVAPSLPWTPSDILQRHLPNVSSDSSLLVCPDICLLSESGIVSRPDAVGDFWVVDDVKSSWSRKVSKTVGGRLVSVRGSRSESNEETLRRLSAGVGAMLSTYRGGDPWWTPLGVQTLLRGVPVVTDWRLTEGLGKCWTHLPYQVEEMSADARHALAETQFESYQNMLRSSTRLLTNMMSMLNH